MQLFRGVEAFVAVVEAGGFRAAAARLGISGAAVSKAIRTLEADTGVSLFARGHRGATLTPEGERFYAYAREAVVAVRRAVAEVDQGAREPHGELVVTAPVIAAPVLARAFAGLLSRHAGLRLQLRYSDRVARLAEEGIDLAVRVGVLEDSSLVGRRLRQTRLWTVASPGYLATRPPPASLDDVDGHRFIGVLGPDGRPFSWPWASGRHAVDAVALVDTAAGVLELVQAGVGLARVLDFMAADAVRTGALVRVLPHEDAAGPDVWALCPPGHLRLVRVQAAMDAVATAFAPP